MDRAKLTIIGLVGGIASGKSLVARRMEARGAHVIAADRIGHELLQSDPGVRRQVVALLGDSVVDVDGSLDRSKIAAKVFGEQPASRQRLQQLEAILHPAILGEVERQLESIRQRAKPAIVVLDAPLLLEAGWSVQCDEVVFVDTPHERRELFAKQRGWSAAEWEQRELRQLPIAEKRRRATVLLDNSGSLEDLERRVDQLMEQWQ